MTAIHKEEPNTLLGLAPEQELALWKKHIYFSFAYVGEVRFYKHNVLAWTASGTEEELIEHARKCLRFFFERGYIPNQSDVLA